MQQVLPQPNQQLHEMHSTEFKKGNLSGMLLRDSSGSQFKVLKRGESGTQSKENLGDMSMTSNELVSGPSFKQPNMAMPQKPNQIHQFSSKTNRDGSITGQS